MKCVVRLSEAQRCTLQQMSLNYRSPSARKRAAGLLLLDSGMSALKVSRELDVSAQSIYNWLSVWEKQGLCGLLTAHGGGRPRALPESMLATAMKIVKEDSSMTLGQIAMRLEAVHGEPMPCVLETLSIALRREGFSFRRSRFSPSGA